MNKQTYIATNITLQETNEAAVATTHAMVSAPAWTRRAVGLSMLGSAAWLAGCGGSDDTASSTGGGSGGGSGGGGSGGGSGGSGGGSTPYVNGGVVTTFAGWYNNGNGAGTADGTGTAAQFNRPRGLAFDGSGILYVADSDNNEIRKITPDGAVTTFAGLFGAGNYVDGTGTAARFNAPSGLAVDSSGNIYVADGGNNMIRKITSAGVVTSLAGNHGSPGTADGTGTGANFRNPYGVAVDGNGNVYVGDYANHAIRKITPAGVVTTLAGQGYGHSGSADGTGTAAQFYNPSGVAVDSSGNVYVADFNACTIRKITSAGVVTTLAGHYGTQGSVDGTGTGAQFHYPIGVAVDSGGTVYVADQRGNTIRQITSAGVVTTLAGSGSPSYADGTTTAASFYYPNSLAMDSSGILYVTDANNHLIRKIS